MIRECMSAKAGLRGLIDLYLNAECIKGWEELKGLKYASTETEAATDCRYLDYDSNPAISAEVAAERGEPNPHKATKTN